MLTEFANCQCCTMLYRYLSYGKWFPKRSQVNTDLSCFGTQAKLHTSDSKHCVISDAMCFVFIIAQSMAENRDIYCKLS